MRSPARSRDRREHLHQHLEDGVDLRQAALAGEPGGERSALRLDHGHAPPPQERDVGGDGRMVPHAAVHGGRHQHRASRGQQHGGEGVVGEAVRGLGDDVRGGRHDQDGGGALGERDVLDRLVALGIEQVRQHRASGQRPEGERSHELAGVLGQAHRHPRAEARQLTEQIHGLVGRDGPRDAEDQLRAGHALDASPSSFTR